MTEPAAHRRKFYFSTRMKFFCALTVALGWFLFTGYLALGWMADLSHYVPKPVAIAVIMGIALLPGFMNAFLVMSLLIDRRPRSIPFKSYPGVSVLIAAFNEQQYIRQTIQSVIDQKYPGEFEIIVIDDGSTDETVNVLRSIPYPQVKILQVRHGGKAAALNQGFQYVRHDLIITMDADTYLISGSLERLVARICQDPPGTAAVAGAVLVRNSRVNWVTRVQEWDYYHGIASVKRLQSLYQGTLVAQGAFSVYRKAAIAEVGGWPETVGEDIVQTWALLEKGYRIGFAENAMAFTNVPSTYRGFFQQRRRWARGLIEAFKHHPGVLFKPRLTTFFFYWNALFPFLDAVYLLVLIPGIIAAVFGYYLIAGPLTLFVLPLTLSVNGVMYRIQRTMFTERRLRVRRNIGGFTWYVLTYQVVMSPASIAGYFAEFIGLRKSWGTK